MTTHPLFHIGVTFLLAIPRTALSQNFASAPAFRAAADLVLIPVSVLDRNGKTVQGLEARNFTVLDDQEPQRILSFENDDAPCSVGLVLDSSGSMRYTLSGAKEIVRAFFATSNPEDEFQLLAVSSQPQALSGFTTDIPALEKSLESNTPVGMTALFDTIHLAFDRMRTASRPRRALLIISDGMDNHSRYSQRALMRSALEADVQVYTILVRDSLAAAPANSAPFIPGLARKPWEQAQERQGPTVLEALSARTGGISFRVTDQVQAKRATIQIGQAIRGEYVIGYQPPQARPVGKWHRIRVKLDIPHVKVHGRNGYYSP